MRTAIISDLHLGVASDEDVLRGAGTRRLLFEEIGGADRLVLLGDVVELRNLPVGPSLERSRPFFEELGEALGDVEVTLLPGNPDAHLPPRGGAAARPALDRRRAPWPRASVLPLPRTAGNDRPMARAGAAAGRL